MNPDSVKSGPAFPSNRDMRNSPYWDYEPGMSLRDYLASKAMQGLLAHPQCGEVGNTDDSSKARTKCVAAEAYAVADAMLAARG